MIIVSRIIHVKVDRRLNVTNKFKYQRRLSSRLAIVMFRGTPCICRSRIVFPDGDTTNLPVELDPAGKPRIKDDIDEVGV